MNVYPGPGNVSVNLFLPLGPARTLLVDQFFFADEVGEEEAREFVAFVDRIQQEDTELCESVQRGLTSGFFDRGKLVLARERALQHFQQLVYRSLADDPA